MNKENREAEQRITERIWLRAFDAPLKSCFAGL